MLEYSTDKIVFSLAARWGADQELKECATYIARSGKYYLLSDELICARRPKPPSLKEQALVALRQVGSCEGIDNNTFEILRRALEALPDA
jgi:hypothetical protein